MFIRCVIVFAAGPAAAGGVGGRLPLHQQSITYRWFAVVSWFH